MASRAHTEPAAATEHSLHLRPVKIPPGEDHPIGRLLARYSKEQDPQLPLADAAKFAHRVYLDLLGILPTHGEVEQFINDDRRDKHEHPCTTIDKPVVIEDLHATLYHAMGISPQVAYEVERRPFYVTRDRLGKPITNLFA